MALDHLYSTSGVAHALDIAGLFSLSHWIIKKALLATLATVAELRGSFAVF